MKIKPFSKELVSTLYREAQYQDMTSDIIDTIILIKKKCTTDLPEDDYINLKKKFNLILHTIETEIYKTLVFIIDIIKSKDFHNIVSDIKNRINPQNEKEFIKELEDKDISIEMKYTELKERYDTYMKEIDSTIHDADTQLCSVSVGKYLDNIEEEDSGEELKGYYNGFHVYCSSEMDEEDKDEIRDYSLTIVPDMDGDCNLFLYADYSYESEITQKEVDEARNKGILVMDWWLFKEFLDEYEVLFEE